MKLGSNGFPFMSFEERKAAAIGSQEFFSSFARNNHGSGAQKEPSLVTNQSSVNKEMLKMLNGARENN